VPADSTSDKSANSVYRPRELMPNIELMHIVNVFIDV